MNNNELVHSGILGMKWGIRRYQNEDGSLTAAGKKRYGANESDSSVTKKVKKDLSTLTGEEFKRKYQVSNTRYMKRLDKYIDPYMNSPLAKFGKRNYSRNENVKGVLKTALGTTIMAKTGKRIADQIKNKRTNPNSKVGYLSVMEKVAGMTIGAVVVASGVKNFIKANSNKTFNTTGMGATAETFTGKQKKQEQNKK